MKQPAIPPAAIKHAPSGWFSARQGAGKKLRRGTGLICGEQFFVSNAVLRHNEAAVQADLMVVPQLYMAT